MRVIFLAAGALALMALSGCSTDCQYCSPGHELAVGAARAALADEAYAMPEDITRTDRSTPTGCVTTLRAPYIDYSNIRVTVDSRGDRANSPEVKVHVATDEILFTRHRDWECRVQELALLNLSARTHGFESAPTALPPAPLPVFGEEPTPLRPIN